jgi:Polyglycine hydrolase-like, structural repeat
LVLAATSGRRLARQKRRIEIEDNMTHFRALWHPGTGAQFWRKGMERGELKDKDQELFDQGLRMRVLRSEANGTYTAFWRPGTGAQFYRTGLEHDEFEKEDKKHFDQGRRLVSMHIEGEEYMGVWHSGTGAQFWRTGLDFDEFKQVDKKFFDQGLRLVTMRRGYDGDDDEFMGLWRSGNGAQFWYTGLDTAKFELLDIKHRAEGLSLVAFTQSKIFALWRPAASDYVWDMGNGLELFKAKDQQLFDSGFRLVDLSLRS